METSVISFYSKFQCLGGACPDTCCQGWKISVDDALYQRICAGEDEVLKKMRPHLRNRQNPCLAQYLGRCPYFTKEKLCRLQLRGREDCMPLICREYPRRNLDFGEFMEMTLELACPAVAALFLQERGRLTFLQHQKRPALWIMGNEDPVYLAFLRRSREELLDYLWRDGLSWRQLVLGIYQYTAAVHDLLMRDRLQEAAQMKVSVPKGVCEDRYGFYSMPLMDRLLVLDVDHPRLRRRNPLLSEGIARYRKIFGRMTGSEAEIFFERQMERMAEADPQVPGKYRSYFSYYLQQMYLTAYEDYHILRIFHLGMACTQMLMLLDLVEFLTAGHVAEPQRQAAVLSSMEKRLRHNAGISKAILERIRREQRL